MTSFAIGLLLGLSNLLGVSSVPVGSNLLWEIDQNWTSNNGTWTLSASSRQIPEICQQNSQAQIEFPRIVHGVHVITQNGNLLLETGDRTFQVASPFYSQPMVPCSRIDGGTPLIWQVTTYSEYFARFTQFPKISAHPGAKSFLNVDANSIGAGSLILISIFSFLIYFGRVSNQLTYAVTFGGLFLSAYFMNCVNVRFGIELPMLQSHKLADICLWVGSGFFFYAFYLEKLLARWMIIFNTVAVALAVVLIMLGETGDAIQLGTMVPMLPYVVLSCYAITRLISLSRNGQFNKHTLTRLLSIMSFFVSGNVDVLSIFGLIDTPMVLPIGIVGAVFGLSVAVNQNIEATYNERDALLGNLENKVAEKTRSLSEAMDQLKSTQADLVQSARLASLGTLSAGVAHEINNSINFVSGALVPLERKLTKILPEPEKGSVLKLLSVIKDGTSLTVEIVKSLRNFTGLNQAEFKDVDIREAVSSVCTILKSKLKDIDLKIDISEDSIIHGNLVGINQIFMNLISNATDALAGGSKIISVTSRKVDDVVHIQVTDNGSGIPPEIIGRIFDPFFTTKEVGKGSGLGLHIVHNEVKRHRGTLKVESTLAKGTSFFITLPTGWVASGLRGAA